MTAAKIQYVSKGFNIRDLGYTYNGMLRLNHPGYGLPWNRIRVQGGAHGAHFGINRAGELYTLPLSRDPNLSKTLDAYNGL